MRFEIEKATLLPLLRRAAACTQERTTFEAFAQARITVADGKVEIVACDSILQMQAYAPVVASKKTKDGVVYVAAKPMLQKVEAMPDGVVSLELSPGKNVLLRHKDKPLSYKVPTTSGEGYPTIQWGDDAPEIFRLSGGTLASLVGSVAWAASTSDAMADHNVLRLTLDGEEIRIAANTHASGARVRMPHAHGVHAAVTLVLRSALEFADFARSMGEEEIVFRATEQHAYIESFAMRLGTAVPVVAPSQLDPLFLMLDKQAHEEIVVPRGELVAAIRAVGMASDRQYDDVALLFVPGAIHVIAEGGTGGEGHDQVAIASPVTHPALAQVAISYLTAICKACQNEDLSLALYDNPSAPIGFVDERGWSTMHAFVALMKRRPLAAVDAIVAEAGITDLRVKGQA